MLTGTIAPLVRRGATVAGSRADEARAAEEARRRLRAACRNPARRAVLHALLSLMRWFVRAREDTRFCRTQLFGLSREVLWRLGAELAAAGALDEAMDVLDLTADEVTGAFDGTLPGADLRGLAAVRRAERVRHLDVPLPPGAVLGPGRTARRGGPRARAPGGAPARRGRRRRTARARIERRHRPGPGQGGPRPRHRPGGLRGPDPRRAGDRPRLAVPHDRRVRPGGRTRHPALAHRRHGTAARRAHRGRGRRRRRPHPRRRLDRAGRARRTVRVLDERATR